MKTKSLVVVALSAVAGSLVGLAIMATIRRTDHYGSQYPGMIRAVTSEHLLHAKLLREGRTTEVLRMLEGTLPSSVLHYDMFRLCEEADLVQLWRIREYGEKHQIEFPAAVVSLLANLPPKPASACDIEEEGKRPNKAPEPTPPSVTPRAIERISK
jgi:hypothetical protein